MTGASALDSPPMEYRNTMLLYGANKKCGNTLPKYSVAPWTVRGKGCCCQVSNNKTAKADKFVVAARPNFQLVLDNHISQKFELILRPALLSTHLNEFKVNFRFCLHGLLGSKNESVTSISTGYAQNSPSQDSIPVFQMANGTHT